jgi:hypothetical protein
MKASRPDVRGVTARSTCVSAGRSERRRRPSQPNAAPKYGKQTQSATSGYTPGGGTDHRVPAGIGDWAETQYVKQSVRQGKLA